MLNNKVKGICSLISAVFTHLIIGNAFTFGNFVYYYKSYLHYQGIDNISILDLLFVAPVSAACLNILPILTGYLDNLFGIRIVTIIASLCLLTSQLIIYFFTKYYLMIIAYIFFGFAGSITYLPTLRNCWKYFPKKKGIISGIVFSSCGLSVFLFTSIGDYIINPNAEEKIDKDFYSKEVAMKYTKYLKFYIASVIVLGTLSSILSFPYKKEKNFEEEVKKINIDEKKDNLINENVDIIDEKDNRYSIKSNKNEENANNSSLEKDEKLSLKECLLSTEFLLCFTMVGCTLLFGFLLTNTYRPFGVSMHLDELGIQSLSKVYTLLNTFSRLLWGFLYDKFGFKYPYRFVCINQIICSSLIYLSASSIYTYFVCCCFGVLSFSGHIILFPNLVTKKFGIDNSVTLLGVCGLLGGTTCLLGPVLTSSIIKNNSDYLKTYIIAGSTTIVSLILTFIIKIEKMKKSVLLDQENNTENIKENIEENNKENSEVNTLESTEGNTMENNIENTHDNTPENNKDNTIESNKENFKSNDTKENIIENIADNNPDNIIENKEKITEDNIEGKEENITENLIDNKEEKLI
jgi:MFS family permease